MTRGKIVILFVTGLCAALTVAHFLRGMEHPMMNPDTAFNWVVAGTAVFTFAAFAVLAWRRDRS